MSDISISSMKANYTQAVEAYKKSNKNISNSYKNSKANDIASNPGHGVLHTGDKMDILSQGVVNNGQFSSLIKQSALERFNKIRNSEKVSLDAIKGKTGMIEVMAAVNDSETALQEIIAVRDKIVSSYLDILKMPL